MVRMINFVVANAPSSTQFSDSFMKVVMPLFYDVGKVIFACAVVWGVYYLMRRQVSEGTDRIKWAAIGYICLRCIDTFIRIVDTVANSMNSRF